jgi:hypothetical protein
MVARGVLRGGRNRERLAARRAHGTPRPGNLTAVSGDLGEWPKPPPPPRAPRRWLREDTPAARRTSRRIGAALLVIGLVGFVVSTVILDVSPIWTPAFIGVGIGQLWGGRRRADDP